MARPTAAGRRAIAREVTRDRIDAGRCLARLAKIEDELEANWRTMDLGEVPALKLLADIQFRKLAKVLPDLKAVELSGQVSHDVIVKFNP